MTKKNPEDIAICLNCYKIKFKPRNKPDSEQLSLSQVFGTENIFDIYNGFVKTIDTRSVFTNKAQNRVLYLSKTMQASPSNNIVAGTVMKGHNGPETAIDELIGGEVTTVGKVSSEQFHCHPYFFLLYANKNEPKEIIFIAQSYKQYGYKEVFEEAFREFVNQNSSQSLTIQFNTLSIASLFEKFIEDGKIYKLRFVKHSLSKTVESLLYGDEPGKEDRYEMELSVKSKRGFFGVKKAIRYNDASFIEHVQLEGFEFEEAYADVVVGGRKRILNITKPSEFCAAYDITHEVHVDTKTKLPNFSEVFEQAVGILKNDLIPYI
ncbi:hypothetical protein SAMN05444008_10196 [Cnuella takakiae]|uniref:Uncharacterized protein n=1 Tax=Cnuella takakiae TaxID=1302690 RepID=A0A1M4SEB5_9BACT|nr:hypothetical protein [Cnuella takakiae]OLY94481.1 hypothetical protein BUE76_23340 [Cnuella takakiae]SHE30550.1 hypothetical protein SAMN05444008_10196 [Cnuella takakiae]